MYSSLDSKSQHICSILSYHIMNPENNNRKQTFTNLESEQMQRKPSQNQDNQKNAVFSSNQKSSQDCDLSSSQNDVDQEALINTEWVILQQFEKSFLKTSDTYTPILQEKPFLWDSKREQQLWYKNLVIPTIQVKNPFAKTLEDQKNICSNNETDLEEQEETNKIEEKRTGIIVKISCWKYLENKTVSQVELSGETQHELIHNKSIFFSGLKFCETTFISRSFSFYLILTFEKTQDTQSNNFLAIYGSPALYIEARKKSKKSRNEKFTSSYLDAFMPQISRIQSESCSKQQQEETKVNKQVGSIEGKQLEQLYTYLEQKEMNKISPFSLLNLFPNLFNVFLNTKKSNSNTKSLNEIVLTIQQKLNSGVCKITQACDSSLFNYDVLVFISVSQSIKNQFSSLINKIISKLSPLISSIIFFTAQKPENIPENFLELIPSAEFKTLIQNNSNIFLNDQYKSVYAQNKTIKTPTLTPKRVTKYEDFLISLEENSRKINYTYKGFTKQGETFFKYSTVVDLKEFPPLEPKLVKKVKVGKSLNKSSRQCNSKIYNEDKISLENTKDISSLSQQNESNKRSSILSSFISPDSTALIASPVTTAFKLDSNKIILTEKSYLSEKQKIRVFPTSSASTIYPEDQTESRDDQSSRQNFENNYQYNPEVKTIQQQYGVNQQQSQISQMISNSNVQQCPVPQVPLQPIQNIDQNIQQTFMQCTPTANNFTNIQNIFSPQNNQFLQNQSLITDPYFALRQNATTNVQQNLNCNSKQISNYALNFAFEQQQQQKQQQQQLINYSLNLNMGNNLDFNQAPSIQQQLNNIYNQQLISLNQQPQVSFSQQNNYQQPLNSQYIQQQQFSLPINYFQS